MKWFKHLSDMRNDPKIKRLLRKYGVTGYGLYTYIIECISSNLDSNKPLPDLEETADDLAYELKIESKLVEEIVTYCVNEKLFTVDAISNRIVCGKIYKFLDDTTRKSPEIAKMIEGFKNIITDSEKVRLIPSESENVLPDIDIELEEDIEKSEKKKESEESFNKFWEIYNKKYDRKKCFNKWIKLKQKDIDKIFETLPSYIKSTVLSNSENKNGIFRPIRKNPLTYLNGECWNDECVYHEEAQKNDDEEWRKAL